MPVVHDYTFVIYSASRLNTINHPIDVNAQYFSARALRSRSFGRSAQATATTIGLKFDRDRIELQVGPNRGQILVRLRLESILTDCASDAREFHCACSDKHNNQPEQA